MQREKIWIIGSALLIGAWVVYAYTVKPAVDKIETLKRVIPEKKAELARLRVKSAEYILLRKDLDSIRAKIAAQEQFELLTFLESIVRQRDLAKNVVTMKPSAVPLASPDQVGGSVGGDYREMIVEVNMSKLTFSELIDFVKQVQSSKFLLKINTLHIKKNAADANLLDPVIEIRGLRKN